MKKVLLAFAVIVVLFVAGVYLFVPKQLRIAEAGIVTATFPAAKRFIFDRGLWSKWADTTKLEQAYHHDITNTFFTKTDIVLSKAGESFPTSLRLIPLGNDSTGIEWEYNMQTGNNPFTRIARYQEAKQLKTHMDSMMFKLNAFLNDLDRVYGTAVRKAQLPDRPLLSKLVVLNREPHANDAYALLSEVKAAARQQNDSAVGPAMKYSSRLDSTHYELMVAIPTSRMLKTKGDFVAKGLVGGNLIATEVRGGEAALQRAWEGIRQYKADYRLSSPAIPFEEFVTDRTIVSDTTKWITKIFYPIRF